MSSRRQLPRRCKAPRSSEPTRRSTRGKCTPSQESVENLDEEGDLSMDDIKDNPSMSSKITPRRSTRGKWPPMQESFDSLEEEGDLTLDDIKDNASMLSYVNRHPPAVYTYPSTPALPISSPSPSSTLTSIGSSTPPPPQSFINNFPYPIISNEIPARPKPKTSHTENLRAPTPDRRLLLTDPNMWWNDPLQARTNPSSDRCYECAKGRTKGKCSLETTSYPCTACVDKGMEDSCRNGLPSSRWERRMLEEKRARDFVAPLSVLAPALAPAGAASGSGSKRRRDPDDDDDGGVGSSRGNNSNQGLSPLRPYKIARSDAPDDESVHPDSPPQDPNRNFFNQVRNSGSGPSICDRCFRLDLICPLEKPCTACLQAGEMCQDSHTHQVYTEIGPTPYLDFKAQPAFPPSGDSNLHVVETIEEAAEAGFPAAYNGGGAPPEGGHSPPFDPWREGQGLEYEELFDSPFFDDEILFPPWEIDEHGQLIGGNPANLDVLAAVPGQDVNMDFDVDIDMNMGDNSPALYPMTPPGRNQSSEDYEDGVDRAIEEMLVALRTWPAVEVGAPTPPGLYYEPFDNTALDPGLAEALDDAARKRILRDRMITYQMYRRDHPRAQPASPPPPPPAQSLVPNLPPFSELIGGLAHSIQPQALQALPQAAPVPPPFQAQIPQRPVEAPAYNLPYYAAWSWDGSGIINGPTPWPFTRVKPNRKVSAGEYGVYENMYDGKCMETKRSILFPSGIGNQNNNRAGRGNFMALCGDTPVKACECTEVAQAEHTQNEHLTCLECFDMKASRAPYRGVGPEERKLFLCVPCANIALGQNGLNVTVYPDCLCQTTLSNTWLCHMHRDKVDEEYVAALVNSDAALIKLGVVGRCISCYVNFEDRNSGGYSCKICRDWVAVNPPLGYVPRVSAVQGGPFGK